MLSYMFFRMSSKLSAGRVADAEAVGGQGGRLGRAGGKTLGAKKATDSAGGPELVYVFCCGLPVV